DYSEMNPAQLRDFVAKNARALSLVRAGFTQECRVPVQYSQSYISNHLEDLQAIRGLTHAFLAEGRLALQENRTNDAVHDYLDVVRLGHETARGGVLIDELVGIAVDATGVSDLQPLVSQLDTATSHEAASALETMDSQAQSW